MAAIEDRTAGEIARSIGALVARGELEPGARLPTIRRLAAALEVSPSTVADAWQILLRHGVISTDRRRGTTVRATPGGDDGRYWQVPVAPGTIELDLSTGTPDKALLPPLGPVLHELHADLAVTSYLDPPLVPELGVELRRRWPYEPAEITVVDGAQDALDRCVQQLVAFGDPVVVEDPTFPPLLDMLEIAGAAVTAIPVDADGIDVNLLGVAMSTDPVAVFIQPRAHNPTGAHLSASRARAIARAVNGTRTVVVEDDHSGTATGVGLESVGVHRPDQVLHIRSFSKSHGPDLRIAALGGPKELIAGIVRRRRLGPAWTSRLIQQILHALLTDPAVERQVEAAAQEYQQRRDALAALLDAHGVEVAPGVGLNMWIRVSDEQRAVVALAAHGIGVAPGSPFRLENDGEHHIRLSLGALTGDETMLRDVAATVASAAAPPPRTTGL